MGGGPNAEVVRASLDLDLWTDRETKVALSGWCSSFSVGVGIMGADFGGKSGSSPEPVELVDPRRPRERNAFAKNWPTRVRGR